MKDIRRAARKNYSAEEKIRIVGGGFIGLEIAAYARSKHAHVTILEALDRPAARSVHKETSERIYRYHTEQGVNVLLNTRRIEH